MLKQAFGVVYALLLLRASVLAFHPEDFTSGAALQCVVCNSSFYCKSGVRYNCPPNSGLPALLEEIEKNGTAEEKNCAEYVATKDAGGDAPDIRFQNGWKRDCDPFTGKVLESRLVDDPSAPGGKRGMRFADFMLHPIVLLCQLTAAEVFALRFYTTAGFKGINWQDFIKFHVASFTY